MRKVILPVANSVDNYIASNDGGVDWLLSSDEVESMLEEMWKSVGAVIMGRATYEFAAPHGMEAYADVDTYVLSSTLNPGGSQGRHACFRRHRRVRAKVEATGRRRHLVDVAVPKSPASVSNTALSTSCTSTCIPVLLGSGLPLFSELDEPVNLKLLECRQLPHGCVALTYSVL